MMDDKNKPDFAGEIPASADLLPPRPHRTNGMTDPQLISYCETHCTTERALFNAEQYNRMVELAGNPAGYEKILPESGQRWGSMHEPMEELCRLARKRIQDRATHLSAKVISLPLAQNRQRALAAPRSPVPIGYAMRHRAGPDVGFSWQADDPMFGSDWERVRMVPDLVQDEGGDQGRPTTPPGAGEPSIDAEEWIDPEALERKACLERFREACISLGITADDPLYALWRKACATTDAHHHAKTVDDRSIEELCEELRIAAVFGAPVRFSGRAAGIILDRLGTTTGQDWDGRFDSWWRDQIRLNEGANIGADYHHWAQKGYFAAQIRHHSQSVDGATIQNGLCDSSFTKVSYQGFTYSFPAELSLPQVFLTLSEMTSPAPSREDAADPGQGPDPDTTKETPRDN